MKVGVFSKHGLGTSFQMYSLVIVVILVVTVPAISLAHDTSTWQRFWWWSANKTWPAGVTDVLKDSFGTCTPSASYCFQRLPLWATEDNTELMAIDTAGTVYEWKFDSKNPTAHAAWLAFHLHQETGARKVKESTPWNPVVREGHAPKAAQDSFMYRLQNSVKSLLLDDDNCDCLSTLSMGHGMCNSGHSTAYGKANVFGVDKLYDPGCKGPTPENGLTLYFRTKKKLTLSDFGGGWRAFWWWSKDGVWPVGVRDVFQDRFGMCTEYDYYCFQTLPSWLREDVAQLLAVDSQGTVYKWQFNTSNPTAHAAWRAFHDHRVTLAGKVKNSNSWNPTALKGRVSKANQDSFMYREQNGVRSLLLDDDNCDCQSTLNVGHGLCLNGHEPNNSKANVFGVDALFDPGCHGPVPGVGLTLYYRVDRPATLDSYGGNWKLFWWWSAGTPWPKCSENKSKIVDVLEKPYGVCASSDEYCFQRLPAWAVDHVTELLAVDMDGTVYRWNFDHNNPTSKAVWNAFHNHKETPSGVVKDTLSWNPYVLKGKSPIVSQDSFMYRSQNGIKSVLLDDDNCDCLSTLNLGHAMCGASSTRKAKGVDRLYDPQCRLPSPNNGLMMYFRAPASRTFQNYGHTWTAFWWWPKDGTWPSAARDVLEHPYGTCKDTDVYCFQRLPPWAVEDHTKLLAIDSAGNVFSWKFSSKNPTAHAAWKAFRDHTETKPGAILNNQAWNPTVIEGKQPLKAQDSFLYSDRKGIKSINLDDDNGYCMNTLSLGADNSPVHEQQFGVDLLYDPKCEKSSYVCPSIGIALYFASARPMMSCSHGGNWLAFWWWNAGVVWPIGESDVLGHPYGHCGPQNLYCFGRIASWAQEDNTELLAVDSHGNEYLWKFTSKNSVAHAAWLAFHDHVTTPAGRIVNKSPAWNPQLLKGTKQKAIQDSFMYRTEHGIKSLLLDDDNCDCLSTLSMGHGMCGATHSTKYSKTGVKGVDVLSDPGCHGPRPDIGLTLYFRSN